MRGSKIEFMLDDDDVGERRRARRRRPHQRQWLICDVADGEAAELLP